MARGPRAHGISATAAATPAQLLERRYRSAAEAAEAAASHVVEASARHLAALMRGGAAARFAALADTASPLTPEDRGKLVNALQKQAPNARPIIAGTASRLAIWRSRLPYQVVPWTVRGLSVLVVIGLGLLAWHRTPERWLTFTGAAFIGHWRLPDGSILDRTLVPGERYALVREEGEAGLLRLWVPGRGYGELWLSLSPRDRR